MQLAFVFSQDEFDAIACWRGHEFKVFAVDVTAGPERRPIYASTFYARARQPEGAVRAVRRDAYGLPSRARFHARLAGPRELGCVPTPQPETSK